MSNHLTSLYGIPPAELGRQLAGMRYDALVTLLRALAGQLHADFLADKERGRSNLAAQLYDASGHTLDAAAEIQGAWEICKPYEKG
jgi:hypothetical protein